MQYQASSYNVEELESRFDDLRNAKALSKAYLQDGEGDDVEQFNSDTNQLYLEFIAAIQTMNKSEGPEKIKGCVQAYKEALDGRDIEGKFVRHWKKILSKKVSNLVATYSSILTKIVLV